MGLNIFIVMEENINDIVDSLVGQLRDNNQQAERVRVQRDPIKKEQLEEFIIQRGGELVQDALDMVQTLRDDVLAAPDDKNVTAYAGLITATSNAIDTLNKTVLSDKKNNTMVKIKEMDIESKRELHQLEGQAKAALTREEIFKMLISNTKPIEAEIVADKRLE